MRQTSESSLRLCAWWWQNNDDIIIKSRSWCMWKGHQWIFDEIQREKIGTAKWKQTTQMDVVGIENGISRRRIIGSNEFVCLSFTLSLPRTLWFALQIQFGYTKTKWILRMAKTNMENAISFRFRVRQQHHHQQNTTHKFNEKKICYRLTPV